MEALLLAFFGGIGATITPCVLPLYPGFLAYVTGNQPIVGDRSLAPILAAALVWFGVVAGMVAIGAVLALVGAPLGDFNRVALPLADGLLITLGILVLMGVNPFARLPQPTPGTLAGRGPAVAAFGYGLLFAPIAVPCSGPFIVGVFAFSLTIGDALGQLLFFTVFGIGFGLPLFVLGTLGQVRGRALASLLVRHERPVGIVLGIALIVVGAWDLWLNLRELLA